MRLSKNLEGLKFGRLLVLEKGRKERDKWGQVRNFWVCKCECGTEKEYYTSLLTRKTGAMKSCGCSQFEGARIKNTTHGHRIGGSVSAECSMWDSAKYRAKKLNIPFDIAVSDIVIPEFCPALGIRLARGKSVQHDASPSLDRTVPELGYIKGNIEVISLKANSIKRNATPNEVLKVAFWMSSQESAPCV